METLRVLELYSGIGGMHYALQESAIPAKVVAAVDVNTTANDIYKHNFPNTPLLPKTIEGQAACDIDPNLHPNGVICGVRDNITPGCGMTLSDFNKLDFDVILMSPPCQPFTRIGLQGDLNDPRTKSFLYILDILPRLIKMPRFILLENVKGFETSSARNALIKTLQDCKYSFQELMISPTCLGIPNSRLRYFLIAKAPPGSFSFQKTEVILQCFPKSESNYDAHHPSIDSHCKTVSSEMTEDENIIYKMETAQELQRKRSQDNQQTVRKLQDFLEEKEQNPDMDSYLLPPKILLRYALLMDIVNPNCRRSVCFTKGYGHYVEGTGSVLQSCTDVELESIFKSLDMLSDEEKLKQLSQLKLRYFTPREIANLMGFPPQFSFPSNISVKQRYRVLGNSLNVHVVAKLISLMVS